LETETTRWALEINTALEAVVGHTNQITCTLGPVRWG